MVIGDAVVGNRVSYDGGLGYPLLGNIFGTNGPNVQVIFDRDILVNQVSEVDPKFLTLSTDGGYFGSLAGIVNYQ